MARLAGKVVFISSGGIGRATAERFAEEGAKVAVAEIDEKLGMANTAGILASDAAEITTGQILAVDGGATIA
jgi:NADP-dependent 3-hydroxy acid dehydrogenase YdfG